MFTSLGLAVVVGTLSIVAVLATDPVILASIAAAGTAGAVAWLRYSNRHTQGEADSQVRSRATRALKIPLPSRALTSEEMDDRTQRYYGEMFDASGENIVVVDSEGVVSYANDGAARLLGSTREAIKGSTLKGAIGEEWAQTIVAGQNGEDEPTGRDPSGTLITVRRTLAEDQYAIEIRSAEGLPQSTSSSPEVEAPPAADLAGDSFPPNAPVETLPMVDRDAIPRGQTPRSTRAGTPVRHDGGKNRRTFQLWPRGEGRQTMVCDTDATHHSSGPKVRSDD